VLFHKKNGIKYKLK